MMTAKAREIGAVNTLFQNSSGLNEPVNSTTARDLATMARYASRYPAFNEASRTRVYKVHRTWDERDTVLKNHAKFLWKFPGADGVKTGWTREAGKCFVGGATWHGWRLISVVLNSPDAIAETARLMKYGFYHYQPVILAEKGAAYGRVRIAGSETETVSAVFAERLRAVSPKGVAPAVSAVARSPVIAAPIAAGDPLGRVEARVGGALVASARLISAGPARLARSNSPFGGTLGASLLGVIGGAGALCYGTALTKTARLRRYRLSASQRSPDQRG
jgi:D-alanyl-D-alanine carboxypeptidase (penicillin-binding protein 5/6)